MANVLVIHDNVEFAGAIAASLHYPIPPVVVGELTLSEIIDQLLEREGGLVEAVYISAELAFKGSSNRTDAAGLELLKHRSHAEELQAVTAHPV